MLFAAAAPLADAAGVRLPADADAVPGFQALHGGADCGDGTDDLVAGDEGVLADAPVVVDQVDVGVADAAVGDLDLDIGGGFRSPGSYLVGQQVGTGRMDGQTMECHSSSFVIPFLSVQNTGAGARYV